ncbi:MAG TPA: S41 family peptidase [Planctomycetota bacterium]|nr:S41 family peptidase [Planctomycetota bacterium]
MIRCLCVAFVAWVSIAELAAQEVSRDGPPLSPFRGMRAAANGIEVQVLDDTWHALDSVAGVDTGTLLRESQRLCGALAWKRVTEDLPALLAAMGHDVGESVDVVVHDLTTGEVRELPAVPMTRENRRRVKDAQRDARGPEPDAAVPAAISAADARGDLRRLRELLDDAFAYRDLRPVDLDALLREAGAFGSGTVDRLDLVRRVDHVLRAFGDGHSRVDEVPPVSNTFLPCLVQQVAGGHVAFRADRSAFVDAAHPFLTAIDGVPLARWLAAAGAHATRGSATMQARDAERGLRDLGDLRLDLEVPGGPRAGAVKLTLQGSDGSCDVQLDVAARRPTYGAWPRADTGLIDGDVGYLRLLQMRGDAPFLDGIDAAMRAFRGTRGLVVDVRGNGGGTRDALRRLAPYLLPGDGEPIVGNVAAILLDHGEPAPVDTLADRGLYPADWPGWSDAQRAAITRFARGFQPSWKLPPGRFSPWHFLVLDRGDNGAAFAYGGKVVVLIDRGCFSATDVFAAALGALPQVTLVGEATSGGSGRATRHVLPKSRIRLQLSTMASFRPDGVLFEGNGVVPDVAVAVEPGDLIGASDTALQRALEMLR